MYKKVGKQNATHSFATAAERTIWSNIKAGFTRTVLRIAHIAWNKHVDLNIDVYTDYRVMTQSFMSEIL